MGLAGEAFDSGFDGLWRDLEKARRLTPVSQQDLHDLYKAAGGTIKQDAFLNHLRGKSSPRLAQGTEYNLAARVVNQLLEEAGEDLRLPLLMLAAADGPDGTGLRGWDSNPQPTGRRAASSPRLRVAAASKTKKQATERVSRRGSRGRQPVPIATRRQAS